jgi:hypothetical protein
MFTVYGSIKNTRTKKVYVWPDNQTVHDALWQLKSVNPTYGLGWTYAGDCGYQEGSICIEDGTNCQSFYGRNAVSEAIEYLEKLCNIRV